MESGKKTTHGRSVPSPHGGTVVAEGEVGFGLVGVGSILVAVGVEGVPAVGGVVGPTGVEVTVGVIVAVAGISVELGIGCGRRHDRRVRIEDRDASIQGSNPHALALGLDGRNVNGT